MIFLLESLEVELFCEPPHAVKTIRTQAIKTQTALHKNPLCTPVVALAAVLFVASAVVLPAVLLIALAGALPAILTAALFTVLAAALLAALAAVLIFCNVVIMFPFNSLDACFSWVNACIKNFLYTNMIFLLPKTCYFKRYA